jgi:hypothetical protein
LGVWLTLWTFSIVLSGFRLYFCFFLTGFVFLLSWPTLGRNSYS